MPTKDECKKLESREAILEFQVKALADRLAILHAMVLDCELESFCNGDLEGARFFEEIQDYAIGPETEAWQVARKKWRKRGEYKQSIRRVKEWLRDAVRSKRLASKQTDGGSNP